MKVLKQVSVVFGLVVTSVGAQAADNIGCIESGYSAQDQASLDDFVAGFTIETFEDPKPPAIIKDVLGKRAKVCAAQYGWSDDAAIAALTMQISALSERGLRRSLPEAAAVVDRVDTDLSVDDRKRFWGIVRELGSETNEQINDDDSMFFGQSIMMLGADGSEKMSGEIGVLLALVSAQRDIRRDFSTL